MPKKQEDLSGMKGPGVAPVQIKEVDDLAEDYIKARDRRCRETPKEVAAKTKLIDSLHKHSEEIGVDDAGILRYEFDDVVVELRPGKETLKVRAAESDDDE